jgi:hypothetical protein
LEADLVLYRVARLDRAGSVVDDEPLPKSGHGDVVVDQSSVEARWCGGLFFFPELGINAVGGLWIEPEGQFLGVPIIRAYGYGKLYVCLLGAGRLRRGRPNAEEQRKSKQPERRWCADR